MRRLALMVALLLPLLVAAQEGGFGPAFEDWLSAGVAEGAVADVADEVLRLAHDPVNVNDSAAMASLPFVGPFRLRALRSYILLYGPLLTVRELRYVPGFDSATVAMLEPLLRAAPVDEGGLSGWWRGRHRLVLGLGGTVEQALGYTNGAYEGDNLRSLLCYTYDYRGHLNIRLSADKDPAEAWGRGNFVGYHLMLTDVGRVERAIVGRYGLQFGQGLVLWTGMAPFGVVGASPMRFGQGIRPAGTFAEEGYLEGAAATVRLWRGLGATLFASRTGSSNLLGGRVGWRGGRVVGGATVAYTALDDSLALRNYVYNGHRFRGRRLLNVGADAVWQWRRLTVYGEVGLGADSLSVAVATGAQVQADSRNRFGISVRRFDVDYHAPHAQAYAVGAVQAEDGVALWAQTRLPPGVDAALSVDLHRFEALRYAAYMPTTGRWLRVRLERAFGRSASATVRYSVRYAERNVPRLSGTEYADEGTARQVIQAEGRMESGRWMLTARAMACLYDTEVQGAQHGWAVGGTARYTHRRLQATVGAVWHNVDGYYARLYCSEGNLQYMWSMPALSGEGLRAWALVRYAVSERLVLGAKYALTLLPGQGAIGTRAAMTAGDHRQTWQVQLRLRF